MSGIGADYDRNSMRDRAVGIMVLIFCTTLAIGLKSLFAGDAAVEPPKKPRFELSGRTITDTHSGLMWALNGRVAEFTYSFSDAFDYIGELNYERYAGYKDWRLPSREELLSLADHAKALGFSGESPDRTVAEGLRSIGILSVQPDIYWSSTGNLYNASEAWYVNFENGSTGIGEKTIYLLVWPVRTAH